VWNRRVVGPLVQTIPPQALTLSNLDLFEYDTAQNELAASTSPIDNVEQVRAAQAGAVVYKVEDQSSTVDGLPAEPFALAATNPLIPLAAPKPRVALTVDRDHVRPDEAVTVTEIVTNPSGDIAAIAASASLNLPSGLTVTSGGSTTWSPGGGTLATHASASHQWTVASTEDGLEQLSATAQASAYDEAFTGSANASLIVDSTPPMPSLACPPTRETNPDLALSWTASDASPIKSYDLGVSTDGGAYAPWLAAAVQTSATYGGAPGHSYAFRLRATDDLGNASDYVECGPVSIGFAPVPPVGMPPAPSFALPTPPHLRVVRLQVTHGRLVVRGRLASGATGSVAASYTVRRHAVRARSAVKSGVYRLSLRLRARGGVLSLRYSGDRAFAPQRVSRRIR
jgi:hypothetical protein